MLRDASRLETSYRVGGALRAVSGAAVDVARRVATAFSPRASRDARVKCRPPAVGGDRKKSKKSRTPAAGPITCVQSTFC